MKIYLAFSIRGESQSRCELSKLVDKIQEKDTIVNLECINNFLSGHGDDDLTAKEIHDRDIKWIKEADVLIAMCTKASLGVGYEIANAIALRKQVLVFNQVDNKLSAMIAGSAATVFNYEDTNNLINSYDKVFPLLDLE